MIWYNFISKTYLKYFFYTLNNFILLNIFFYWQTMVWGKRKILFWLFLIFLVDLLWIEKLFVTVSEKNMIISIVIKYCPRFRWSDALDGISVKALKLCNFGDGLHLLPNFCINVFWFFKSIMTDLCLVPLPSTIIFGYLLWKVRYYFGIVCAFCACQKLSSKLCNNFACWAGRYQLHKLRGNVDKKFGIRLLIPLCLQV